MMHKNLFIPLSAIVLLALTSCSKLGVLSSDNFNVTPNPLETQAGQVPVTINGLFPEKYMNKKAVVTVIPELRYGNGLSTQGSGATFQGEKVRSNDQTISYRVGGRYTMKTNFVYTPDMHKSDLYLTFDAKIGKKKVKVPAVKVATGIIATSELSKNTLKTSNPCLALDSFKRVTEQKQEANIKFLIQQANLRKSELKNNSVKEFVNLLKKINKDKEGLNINNVEISAYASPDGGVKLNDKLANKRQNVSETYVKGQLKQTKVSAPIDAKYTAQDWEGFQELVKASNIQDKDLIIRVLSMYQDPQQREQQIRNMSAAFKELADGILPELRRSRLTINYETIGRDDQQILDQLGKDAKELSVEEMLYAATLKDNNNDKETVYKQTIEVYPNDYRAYNNIAVMELAKGNTNDAKAYLQKALEVNPKAPEANGNLGYIALLNNNKEEAETYILKAQNANGINEVLGNLNLAKGNYAEAENNFNGINSNSAALAQILNKDYAKASNTLKGVKNNDAITDYLSAILNARTGNNDAASIQLKRAISKDSSLADYATNDLEFAKIK